MMRQYLQKAVVYPASLPKSITGAAGTTPIAIDHLGFDSMILNVATDVPSAAQAGAKLTLTAVEGTTSSPATAITFNNTPTVIDTSSGSVATNTTYFIDLRGLARYLKFTVTGVSANTANNVVAVTAVLGDANLWTDLQVSAASKANGTTDEVQEVAAVVYAKA